MQILCEFRKNVDQNEQTGESPAEIFTHNEASHNNRKGKTNKKFNS